MVEFALVIVLLLTIVLGIMETCLALFAYNTVSESAREGARYAVMHGDTCSAGGINCTATSAQVQNFVQNLGFPGINPAKMAVTVAYSSYPIGVACSPNANCANPGNLVTVTVIYPFPFNIPFLPSNTLNLTSTSARVISQ